MKCLILSAGYATRLYPLTENFPKPLLKVGEKTILDWLIEDINSSSAVDEFIVISNHKFAHHFEDWAKEKIDVRITVIDDGTDSNETRLGAVKDVQFAIDKLGINTDVLVIAGDNLLDFSLCSFIKYAQEKCASSVMRYYESDINRLKKCGVLEIDDDECIIGMEEKPQEPKSHWCCPPFYYYTAEDTARVKYGIEAGCGTDAPGSYIAWLASVTKVYAMQMPGKRYDIGNLESYEKVQNEYRGITNAQD